MMKIKLVMMIMALGVLMMSGCGQPADPTKNTTNTAPNTTANSANTATNNAATNTATNSEVAKSNTNTEAANTSPVAPPKPDNCNGPADNEVIVYEDVFSDNGGGGKCVKLKPGEYKNAGEMGFANDSMSSIKVGVNVRATVCDNENFTAPCEEFEKTDYNLMDNPTIKNDTASSLKVVEVKAETKPEAKPEAVKAFTNTVVGEWTSSASTKLIFAEDKFEEKGPDNWLLNSTPYKVVDGKTIEFNDSTGQARKSVITFEDNGNTLIWYRPEIGSTFKLKRVNPK